MEAKNLRKMIDELRRELLGIQYAIRALEALAGGRSRRGRPSKFALELFAAHSRGRKQT